MNATGDLQALSRMLCYFDFEVVAAQDYQTGRIILDECEFDVLTTDVVLPDGHGCDLLIEAKSKQPFVSIALIAYGEREEQISLGKES